MKVDPEILLTMCEFDDDETGLAVSVESIETLPFKTVAHYKLLFLGDEVGRAWFEYLPECDTVFFVSVEIDDTAHQNQGFTTRWLRHNETVFAENELRRASVAPAGFAENLFRSAGWRPNTEDQLGTNCAYYTLDQ